jgi:3-(3-hydroxy-phenyl)propionate hydroxylase
MSIDYQRLSFDYQPCREQLGGTQGTAYPVIVVGAGPVGLATAIDIAQQGVPVVLVDDDCSLSTGSRAICFSKRSLDIFDRLGCGQRMVDKGISWNVGKVFLKDELVYTFNLLPESGHNRPAFINLQQYYVEGYLLERAREYPCPPSAGRSRAGQKYRVNASKSRSPANCRISRFAGRAKWWALARMEPRVLMTPTSR